MDFKKEGKKAPCNNFIGGNKKSGQEIGGCGRNVLLAPKG